MVPTQIEINDEDLRAYGVLCELAGEHGSELDAICKRRGVQPEWLVGLMMKFEKLVD